MTTAQIAELVARWREEGTNTGELQSIVRRWCAEVTAEGMPVDRQLHLLAMVGIVVGGGGQGRDPDVVPCPYCHATDPGGHGRHVPEG